MPVVLLAVPVSRRIRLGFDWLC